MRSLFRSYRHSLLPASLLFAGLVLGGCGGDEDPATQASTPASSPPVAAPPPSSSTSTSNQAPTLNGTPVAAIHAGADFAFSPSAADADGDKLSFSIANKPAWMTFSTVTGELVGTPSQAHVGSYQNIVIGVSDGKTTVALPGFSVAVTQISTGRATLSWMPPTENTDGSQLTNLSGYRIYYGNSPTTLDQNILINAGFTSYVIENLSPATWYFAIKAIAGGTESSLSGVVSKTVS